MALLRYGIWPDTEPRLLGGRGSLASATHSISILRLPMNAQLSLHSLHFFLFWCPNRKGTIRRLADLPTLPDFPLHNPVFFVYVALCVRDIWRLIIIIMHARATYASMRPRVWLRENAKTSIAYAQYIVLMKCLSLVLVSIAEPRVPENFP